jgi:hypothetical protein
MSSVSTLGWTAAFLALRLVKYRFMAADGGESDYVEFVATAGTSMNEAIKRVSRQCAWGCQIHAGWIGDGWLETRD